MTNTYTKDISGSVQEKRGKLYLVVSYKDSVTQKRKTKWMALGLPVGAPKSAVSKAEREAKNKFESEYRRFLEGYDDPKKYPLLPFLNDWLDNVHIRRIQESTYNGYKGRINGKMKKYFGEKITLADCKPRLIYGFYEYLREDGDGEQTVLHYAKGTIHAYIQQKHIFAVQISGKYIIPKSAIVEFLVGDFAFEIVHKSLWHMNTILGFTEKNKPSCTNEEDF